jgi:hypothetical protein
MHGGAMKKQRTSIEALETRIVPASVFAINDNNGLFSFDSENPGNTTSVMPITGIAAGQLMKAIDFRPADGLLYGVAFSGAAAPFTGQLYRINFATSEATAIGSPFSTTLASNSGIGIDFNPVVDRIRLTNAADENIRINPNTGALAGTDIAITGAGLAAALAYTNSFPGATSTTLYAVDFSSDDLHIIGGLNGNPGPNGGVGTKVADISVVGTGLERTSLDILTTLEGNRAFYAINNSGTHRLYDLSLTSGTATLLGTIGNGTTPVFDIAVSPHRASFTPGKSFTYTDGDGDLVTVKTTAGTLDPAQFGWLFSTDGTRRELTSMNIGGDATFTGANLTFSAKKTATGGDGRVDVGYLDATLVNLGAVKIGGNIESILVGTNDASIPAMKSFSALSMVRGSSANELTAPSSVLGGNVPSFKVKGDISGVSVSLIKAGTVAIGGSLIGSDADESGALGISNLTKSLTIGGSIVGGNGQASGYLSVTGASASVKIGGSIIGDDGTSSGYVSVLGSGKSTVAVGGSIIGGDNLQTGFLQVLFPASNITIGGSIVGGSGSQTGIIKATTVGSFKVGGSIVGGSGTFSGTIDAGTVGTLAIGGGIHAGTANNAFSNGLSLQTAKSITIKGGVFGNADFPALIAIIGKTAPASAAESVALGSLSIGGSVVNGEITIGFPGTNVNAAAGKITIGGDFIASSISAGIREGTDGFFGNADDAPAAMNTLPDIKAAIGSIIIKGRASGTGSDGDHYGIQAEQLGSVSIAGRKLPLTTGTDSLLVGAFGDLRVREVAIP